MSIGLSPTREFKAEGIAAGAKPAAGADPGAGALSQLPFFLVGLLGESDDSESEEEYLRLERFRRRRSRDFLECF
eukprot:CAMPEP_0197539646 /NCGR_PEP_ID=MMETSP1318-20131121/63382_1 /TAXON_ID=552666 /ORGANISM="Partenskyella glossopodia, Strain RCC365" /LENGTH=74 /DNA_ID=CAMNT_0043098411 /DNA_START=1172 /DNA_END=1393 /DNA_ORIENTATION=+